METPTIAIIIVTVAAVAAILYVWDRRTKKESVDWANATKLAVGAGSIAGGVAYAVGTEDATAVVEAVSSSVQEMFVGRPSF
jgi:uncharacterized membrane protein YfcA